MRAMDFTTACKTYLADGAATLGQSFAKENNLYVIERMWPHMGLHCRMEFAADVARAQADFFNRTFPGMSFTPPPLSAVSDLDACGEFSYEQKDAVGEIHLSDRYVLTRSPQKVAATIWHEGVHAALYQLGVKGGAFTADAELKKNRVDHDTNPNLRPATLQQRSGRTPLLQNPGHLHPVLGKTQPPAGLDNQNTLFIVIPA